MNIAMIKGKDYIVLGKAGLPIPIYGVFNSSCLTDEGKKAELRNCVDRILTSGSGLVGVWDPNRKGAVHLWGIIHITCHCILFQGRDRRRRWGATKGRGLKITGGI